MIFDWYYFGPTTAWLSLYVPVEEMPHKRWQYSTCKSDCLQEGHTNATQNTAHSLDLCTGLQRKQQVFAQRLLRREVLEVGVLAVSLLTLRVWCCGVRMTLDYTVWCRWETIKHMLLERGSGSFSSRTKPADCGYGKYIPIMCSLWS